MFKFKKSTEKLTNKRTSSANSKSKRRNNSQSQNTHVSQTAGPFHNKTHSLNQIGSGASIGLASVNGGAQSASLRNKNLNNNANQIQQLLMSFYQGQSSGSNPVIPQFQNQSRATYSKSIYENKGSSTIRDSQRQAVGSRTAASKGIAHSSTHNKEKGLN